MAAGGTPAGQPPGTAALRFAARAEASDTKSQNYTVSVLVARLIPSLPDCENPYQMNLTINGETRILAPAETLSALVEQLGMKSDRVAIELNREIVPREQWAQTPLKDGDRLEIVHFVGGGSGPQSSGLKAQGQEARAYAASP